MCKSPGNAIRRNQSRINVKRIKLDPIMHLAAVYRIIYLNLVRSRIFIKARFIKRSLMYQAFYSVQWKQITDPPAKLFRVQMPETSLSEVLIKFFPLNLYIISTS